MVLSCPFYTFLPPIWIPLLQALPTFFLPSSSVLWALPHGGSVFKYLGQLHSQGFTVAPAAHTPGWSIGLKTPNAAGLLRSRRAEMMDGKCCYADSRRRRKSNTFQRQLTTKIPKCPFECSTTFNLTSQELQRCWNSHGENCRMLYSILWPTRELGQTLATNGRDCSTFIVTVKTSFELQFLGNLKVLCLGTIAMIWHLKKITSHRITTYPIISYHFASYEYSISCHIDLNPKIIEHFQSSQVEEKTSFISFPVPSYLPKVTCSSTLHICGANFWPYPCQYLTARRYAGNCSPAGVRNDP